MFKYSPLFLLLAVAAVWACSPHRDGGSSESTASSTSKNKNKASRQELRKLLTQPQKANEKAPNEFTVRLETTAGDILIDVHREWAPRGADRFYNLVNIGFYDDVAFFRVIKGFMAQTGLNGDPAVNKAWRGARIQDDPVKQSNVRGMVTFAKGGPDSRTTQFFINFGDNRRLDPDGFPPFGEVRNMDIVDRIHSGYGEGAPRGRGPSQQLVQMRGNEYLREQFPELDYIRTARVVE